MDINNIKTSRDLADLLEDVVKLLRTLPELPLKDTGLELETLNHQMENQNNTGHKQNHAPSSDLVSRLPDLGRDNAKEEIQSLTLDAIRQLATSLEIRIPSRATKSETVQMLLEQVFDMPAGHDRIRTFHKRKASS